YSTACWSGCSGSWLFVPNIAENFFLSVAELAVAGPLVCDTLHEVALPITQPLDGYPVQDVINGLVGQFVSLHPFLLAASVASRSVRRSQFQPLPHLKLPTSFIFSSYCRSVFEQVKPCSDSRASSSATSMRWAKSSTVSGNAIPPRVSHSSATRFAS